jgi:hypothetical protein
MYMWTCEYCKTDNMSEDGYCIHCGSPRRNNNEFLDVGGTLCGTFSYYPLYNFPSRQRRARNRVNKHLKNQINMMM